MDPVFGREVIEGKDHVPIFYETVAGLLELFFVDGKERVVSNQGLFLCLHVMDLFLGLGLDALGHLIQDVHGLVNPAALLLCLGVYFPEGSPEP